MMTLTEYNAFVKQRWAELADRHKVENENRQRRHDQERLTDKARQNFERDNLTQQVYEEWEERKRQIAPTQEDKARNVFDYNRALKGFTAFDRVNTKFTLDASDTAEAIEILNERIADAYRDMKRTTDSTMRNQTLKIISKWEKAVRELGGTPATNPDDWQPAVKSFDDMTPEEQEAALNQPPQGGDDE
jgi:restriction endonuclease